MTVSKLSTKPGGFLNNNINTLIVALTIIYSGSLYYSTFYLKSLTANFYLIPLLIILFMICLNRGITYSRINILFLLLTLMIVVKGSDVDYLKTPAVYCAVILSAFLIVSIISFEQFSEKYLRIVLILSVLSWLAIPFTYFQIYSILPNFISADVRFEYENYIFFAIQKFNIDAVPTAGISVLRSNGGIFWEPGAWQIFVNTGFILGMANRLITYRRYLIILLTNLSIASTTGLIVFLLLSIVIFASDHIQTKGKIALYFLLIISIVAVLSLNFFADSVLKLIPGTSAHGSFITRLDDNMLDLNVFLEHLFNGVGIGNMGARQFYSDLTGIRLASGSDGLMKFISEVGILGFVVIKPIIFPTYLNKYRIWQRLIFCFCFVLMFNTEGMMPYLLPWIIAFYGLKKVRINNGLLSR